MKQEKILLQHAVGKRTTKNIVNQTGHVLIPEGTLVKNDDLAILVRHGVELTEQDVAPAGPYLMEGNEAYEQVINESVVEVQRLFEQVRHSREISLANIRKNVLPAISKLTDQDPDLLALFAALQAKDDYTYRHTVAVAIISSLIGKWMGLEKQDILQLTTAALLHDVGNMLIPDEILHKSNPLTLEEHQRMKTHTIAGYELLKKAIGITHRQALVALQHHERLDGSGYPLGIAKDQIDIFSRIVAVADVFHAMTSTRVYREASSFNEVLYQMTDDSFGTLDPFITKHLIEKIMHSLIGRTVLLTDGRQGQIRMVHLHDPIHPLIQVDQQFIDLSKEQIHIKGIL